MEGGSSWAATWFMLIQAMYAAFEPLSRGDCWYGERGEYEAWW